MGGLYILKLANPEANTRESSITGDASQEAHPCLASPL